jgi:hypothetical protein
MTAEKIRRVKSAPGDIPGDPWECVMAHAVRRQFPWAKRVTVGRKTIKVYDYRCPHNPTGNVGECAECPGRGLVWATPLTVAEAIAEFDRNQCVEFPAFELREGEARVVVSAQDKVTKRRRMAEYTAAIKAGEIKPAKRTAKARARAKTVRRRS